MKKLYVSNSLIDVESRKEILDQAGIPNMVRNQQLTMLAGEVPFAEVFPELWVINDEDLPRAQELLANWEQSESVGTTDWTCAACGEHHDKEYTACWKCGREKGAESKPGGRGQKVEHETDKEKISTANFLVGFLLGVIVTFGGLGLRDYLTQRNAPTDRNGDGKVDMVEKFVNNKRVGEEYDSDFDGMFETIYKFNDSGFLIKVEVDRDQDGTPDLIERYRFGNFVSQDFLDPKTGFVTKRSYYKLGVKTEEKVDVDGDGKFDKVIHYDELEDPVGSEQIPQ